MLVCPSCCHLCYWWNAEWAFFPLRYTFSRGANSGFLSLFSFLLLQFFAEVWLYVLLTGDAVYVEQQQQQQDCFAWLKGRLPSALNYGLPSYPPTEKWPNVVMGGNTQTAHGCVYADSNAGINFIISSATAHLSSRGLSYVSQLDAVRLACLAKPRFTASLNSHPTMFAFKGFKPQRPCLSFIISVCGRRKKLMWGKNCHSGIQIAWVWHQTNWPRMGTLFDYCSVCSCSFFLDFALCLPTLLLFLLPCFLLVSLSCTLGSAPKLLHVPNSETDANFNHLTSGDESLIKPNAQRATAAFSVAARLGWAGVVNAIWWLRRCRILHCGAIIRKLVLHVFHLPKIFHDFQSVRSKNHTLFHSRA